jgi:hypothetical protein
LRNKVSRERKCAGGVLAGLPPRSYARQSAQFNYIFYHDQKLIFLLFDKRKMTKRFSGEANNCLFSNRPMSERCGCVDKVLAVELTDLKELIPVNANSFITQQGAIDKGLSPVIADAHDIVVGTTRIHRQLPGDLVGEMAAVQSIHQRSAMVSAVEES